MYMNKSMGHWQQNAMAREFLFKEMDRKKSTTARAAPTRSGHTGRPGVRLIRPGVRLITGREA
jgi:hypothetical protein